MNELPVPRAGRRAGSGLIEVLIAFVIVAIGLGASLGLVLMSGATNRRSELTAIATGLAREPIEVARGMRDTNWRTAGAFFDDGLYNTADEADPYGTPTFSTATNIWTLNFSGDRTGIDARVFLSNGVYMQAVGGVPGGTSTPFMRSFVIQPICWNGSTETERIPPVAVNICDPVTEKKIGVFIEASVIWTRGSESRTVRLFEHLYDWQP